MAPTTSSETSESLGTTSPVFQPVHRLCNEIQLFDLCEKERCSHKIGRFCSDPDLLFQFEKIEEQESRRPEPNESDFSLEENELYDDDLEYDDNENCYDTEIYDDCDDE